MNASIPPQTSDSKKVFIRLFQFLIVFGIALKLYGVNDPWKRHDHYNYGGIFTTTYAECLKSTPLAQSKGVPHICRDGLETNLLHLYKAHPPSVLFGLWGWTNLFGSSEAAYRLFIFFFSTLNIGLLFFIARRARPESEIFPWAAAAFQACFLGNMYFGTHLDFIGEFTVFFLLATALAALHQHLTLACFFGLLSGLSSWPGYIVFGPLWLYSWSIGRGRKRVFLCAVFGFACALATMMWLHQTLDILDFLRMKLTNPGYIQKREKDWLEPLRFLKTFVTSQARLLSPLFASLAFFELFAGSAKDFLKVRGLKDWQNLTPFHHAVLLSGGTGLIYALIGHEYVMVHVYLYLLFTPGLALLAARFCERAINGEDFGKLNQFESRLLAGLSIAFIAFYPYGIFKTKDIHDAINSLALAGSAGALLSIIAQARRRATALLSLVTIAAVANGSQVMNYRNEPDTERSFCEKARAEYRQTGKPVETEEVESDAKRYIYCVGIPIHYGMKESSQVTLEE